MGRTVSESLHEATLALLEHTGVRVESKSALDLFAAHGIRVDFATHRVYPGADHIRQALSSAPGSFKVYGRRTENPLILGGDDVYIMSGGASIRVLNLEGNYEKGTWEHLRQFNILLDALPNVHMLLNQVDPQDSSPAGYYRRIAAEMMIGSPKPCCLQAMSVADVEAMVEMGSVIRGSRRSLAEKPIFITGTNAEPPLCIPEHAAEIHIAASRAGIPCGIGDYVMAGITAPATLAGALVQRNAIQLVALVLSQIAQPGAPFYFTGSSASANMKTLDPLMANPQAVRLLRYSIELGRTNHLPVVGLALTDAKMPDSQAACEMTTTFLTAVQAGAHLIQGPTSMMDQMMLSSFAQAVIDNDIVGYLLAARSSLKISEEMLALDVIHDVVMDPSLENFKFAAHPHTRQHMRDDHWEPRIFTYDNFTTWQKKGSSVVERANAMARDIITRHQPEPLAPHLIDEIRRIANLFEVSS